MTRTCQQSPRAGGALRKEGDMPICEILVALSVAALAADSATVIRLLARLVLGTCGRWKKHKRE